MGSQLQEPVNKNNKAILGIHELPAQASVENILSLPTAPPPKNKNHQTGFIQASDAPPPEAQKKQ